MKRLSQALDEFKSNTSFYFKEIKLNKSSPKYNPLSYRYEGESSSRGVETDFITIFKDKVNTISFAFNFNYIDIPVENQTVIASLKRGENNDSIISSNPMSVDEFKEKLNEINRYYRNDIKNNSSLKIIEKFSSIFLEQTLDLNKEIKEADKTIGKIIKEKESVYNLQGLQEKNKSAQKLLEDTTLIIHQEITTSSEYQELEKLKKRVKELENTLTKKEIKLEKDYNLRNIKENADMARYTAARAKKQVDDEVLEALRSMPKIVTSKIKFK